MTYASFAHFPGEDPEQTAAFVASLEVSLQAAKDHGDAEAEKEVRAELRRILGSEHKQLRPRSAAGKQTRADG